jgi:hypothetical protein
MPVRLSAVVAALAITTAVMTGASAPAHKFALFILSADGQRTLAKHGFTAPALSQ